VRETLRGERYDDGIFEEKKNPNLIVPIKQLDPDRNSRTSLFEEGETNAGRETQLTTDQNN